MFTTQHDIELLALQTLQQADSGSPNQRDLAQILGVSLGMTNAIVKRLTGKGFVTLRKINGRSMQYALTPEGTREIARRSYRYMRRTIGNVVRWKESIDTVIQELKAQGVSRIELVGHSDLAFMVEHSCRCHRVDFAVVDRQNKTPQELPLNHTVAIMSETYEPESESAEASAQRLYLRSIITP